jgi:hypothetical protein
VLDAVAAIARDKRTTMSQFGDPRRPHDQLTANLPTGMTLSAEETALLDQVSQPRVDYPYGATNCCVLSVFECA